MLFSQTSSGSTRASFDMNPSHETRLESAVETWVIRSRTVWLPDLSGLATAAMRAFSTSSCCWLAFVSLDADCHETPSSAATAIAAAVPPIATECLARPLPRLTCLTCL